MLFVCGHSIPSGLLRYIHCGVSSFEQNFRIGGSCRIDRTDAETCRNLKFFEFRIVIKRRSKFLRSKKGVFLIRVRHKHDEFISTKARQHIRPAERAFSELNDSYQHIIASPVAVSVIDCLKIVEVEEDERDFFEDVPVNHFERLFKLIKKSYATARSRQRVLNDLLLQSLLFLCGNLSIPLMESDLAILHPVRSLKLFDLLLQIPLSTFRDFCGGPF